MKEKIVDFDYIDKHRSDLGKIVCTSGGFDPIHPGHLSCIYESSKLGNTLIVIVNGDFFLTQKKGKPFQDLLTRCKIVSYISGVDFVVPFESKETTVSEALKLIKPHIFTKGGDRVLGNIPESDICSELGIQIETGIGDPKEWSSSDFLESWGQFYAG